MAGNLNSQTTWLKVKLKLVKLISLTTRLAVNPNLFAFLWTFSGERAARDDSFYLARL